MSSGFSCACWMLGIAIAVGCAEQDAREERDATSGSARMVDAEAVRGSADAGQRERAAPPQRADDAGARARMASAFDASAPAQMASARDAGLSEDVQMARARGTSKTDAGRAMNDASATATDAGGVDAGASTEPPPSCLPFAMPSNCVYPANSSLPTSLHCAGLYADIARSVVTCGLTEYAPAYELWSDGAVKRRWVALPSGSSIDTRDPDGFVYPVGTEFWKEFQVQHDGALRRAETRLLRKVERGWVLATYVWAEDGRSATLTNDGVASWQGSGHTVPTRDQCVDCHAGRKDLVLGWDPVLLGPGAKGLHLEDLPTTAMVDDDAGALPLSAAVPPGDAVEQAALGYLHVNCGVSCHNESIEARARDTALYLRLATGRADAVLSTPAVLTAINKRPTGNAPFFELPEPAEGSFYDLLPGSPARSLLLARMLVRDNPAQMPPLASNVIDERGTAAVSAWIASMTPEHGYPEPAIDPVTEPVTEPVEPPP